MNTIDHLRKLYSRDLNRLKSEVESYQSEVVLWQIDKSIANSGGNLCLHLVGNLKAFIGAQLGKTGYVRDRPFEFAGRDVPRKKLVADIIEVSETVDQVLGTITAVQLDEVYPLDGFGKGASIEYVLLSLLAHLNYHLGQINYHRRLLDG